MRRWLSLENSTCSQTLYRKHAFFRFTFWKKHTCSALVLDWQMVLIMVTRFGRDFTVISEKFNIFLRLCSSTVCHFYKQTPQVPVHCTYSRRRVTDILLKRRIWYNVIFRYIIPSERPSFWVLDNIIWGMRFFTDMIAWYISCNVPIFVINGWIGCLGDRSSG